MKYTKFLILLTLFGFLTACSEETYDDTEYSPYVTTLFEYMPAPGQFINKPDFGTIESAQSILGKKGSGVSLGAFGGYIILGFDHNVTNKEGNDLIIYSNSMPAFAEPGIVWVMPDDNNNGQPDDIWYELAGSELNKNDVYKRNYAATYYRPDNVNGNIAWTDNMGAAGTIYKNEFHPQPYYPEWIENDSYTLYGSVLNVEIDSSNPLNIIVYPLDWGYADNTGEDRFDISNAIDVNGNKIKLATIRFIKIQTGILANMGRLGEISTEVLGVADLDILE